MSVPGVRCVSLRGSLCQSEGFVVSVSGVSRVSLRGSLSQSQGFVVSVSGVRQRSGILRLFSTIPFLAEKVKAFIHKHFKTYVFFSNIYHFVH